MPPDEGIALLEELKTQLGHVSVTAPPHVALTLDGQPVLDWARPIDVLPGSHTLTATNGWQLTRNVVAPAGQEVSVVFEEPEAHGRPTEPSSGSAPVEKADPVRTEAEAAPSRPAARDDAAPRYATSPVKLAAVASLAGLAVVSAGVGVFFGVQSVNKSHDIDALNAQRGGTSCPAAGATLCQNLSTDYSSQGRDATTAGVLYASAGALAVGAIAAWFFWPQKAGSATAWLLPSINGSGASLTVGSTF